MYVHTHTHTPAYISHSPRRKGPQKSKQTAPKKSYFGSELADITTESNPLPLFLVRCVELVEKDGLDVEGIYRLSGKQDDVVEVHCKFDQGVLVCTVCMCIVCTVHTVCGVCGEVRWSYCTTIYIVKYSQCIAFGDICISGHFSVPCERESHKNTSHTHTSCTSHRLSSF